MIFRRNVLILHQGALGDFVTSWPLAMAMGRMFPQSRIIYITSREKGRLAERAVRVEAGDTEDGWHMLFAESPKVPESVAKLLAGAHTIFSFISQPGDVVSRNLQGIAPHANRFDMTTNATPGSGHVSQRLVDDLKPLPAAAEAVRQMLRSIADRGLGTHRPVGRTVTLHPGSGADRKNWPAERFLELAAALRNAGHDIFTVLGEVEQEKWSPELIARFEAAGRVVTPKTFVDLYEELIRTAAFIGNDSGPGHLAGIIGVPTVSIFGSSDPASWHPLGPRTAVVHRDSLDGVQVADVLEALRGVGAVTQGEALRSVS
ncbi:glycosyltransferase family 9 protein [soil metagenome]